MEDKYMKFSMCNCWRTVAQPHPGPDIPPCTKCNKQQVVIAKRYTRNDLFDYYRSGNGMFEAYKLYDEAAWVPDGPWASEWYHQCIKNRGLLMFTGPMFQSFTYGRSFEYFEYT